MIAQTMSRDGEEKMAREEEKREKREREREREQRESVAPSCHVRVGKG